MTQDPELTGGIIAAGEGRRLRRAGWTVAKPLVPIAGVPLIELVVRNFVVAGIRSLTVILNEQGRDCADRIRRTFPELAFQFIVKKTASSLESFVSVVRHAAASGPMLISTVDAFCLPGDFVRFVDAARSRPSDAVVLGVTPMVADEKPLWVALDDEGRALAIGEPAGRLVTAGLYLVPDSLRRSSPPELGRLRDYLIWLHEQGQIIFGEIIDRVVDVDRAEDIVLAEALAQPAGPRDVHQETVP